MAPPDAWACFTSSSSLSRLNLRRQAASPTPLDANRVSSIESLSMTGRSNSGASCSASVVFPLPGKPVTITNRFGVEADILLPAHHANVGSARGPDRRIGWTEQGQDRSAGGRR